MKKLEITESNLKKFIKESINKVLLNEQSEDKLSTLADIVQKYNEAIQYIKKEQRYIKAANLYKIALMRHRNQVARVYNAIVYEMNGVPEAKESPVLNNTIINTGWLQQIKGKHFLYYLTKLDKFKGISRRAQRNANKIMRSRFGSYITRQLGLRNGQLINENQAKSIRGFITNLQQRQDQKLQAKNDRKQNRLNRKQERQSNKTTNNDLTMV